MFSSSTIFWTILPSRRIKSLQFSGPDFFENPYGNLPNSTQRCMFPLSSPNGLLLARLLPLGSTVRTRPRCCTPKCRLNVSSHCLRAESRCSRSCSTNRCSCSRTTRRHSRSHCCSTDRPHGLTGDSAFVNTKIQNSSSLNLFLLFRKYFRVAYATFNRRRHSTPTDALYSLTLVALTILPRKASREPMLATVIDES